MLKVYTQEALIKERKEKAKDVRAYVFGGDRSSNARGISSPEMSFKSSKTSEELREEMEELRAKIVVKNAAQAPSAEDIEAFFGKFFVDVQRRAMESPDLTSVVASEQVNFEFPEIVSMRDVKKYRGIMGIVEGTNDGVPLIEQNGGNLDTVTMSMLALGWKDTIKNMLYNKFFTMDKVVQAAVDAYIDERNKQTVGVIIGATYVASQKQAAIATAGLTLDEKTYETVLAANNLVRELLDIQTERKISVAAGLQILCNSADTFQLENVIRGQLNGNGSSARTSNRPALPIGSLVEYDHGINDGFIVGKEDGDFPGVTAGKCYLYVPGMIDVLTKRPLTMESGRGSVLELSTEERAWYMVQGVYTKAFLGSSYPGTTVGAGYGYVVEITLPT